jgi:hypothetical protein
LGFVDASADVAAGDVEPLGQHLGEFAAEFGGGGLGDQLVEDRMLRDGESAPAAFQVLEYLQKLLGGQCVERHLGQILAGSLVAVEHRRH